jgi:hypothetical protein
MTPISSQIKPVLEEFIKSSTSFEFDEFDDDEEMIRTRRRYLFYMKTERTRCLTSSNWTGRVKDAFRRFSNRNSEILVMCLVSCVLVRRRHSPNHTATPPSLLRSSFITWMRENTSDPEILSSAAVAQKHSVAMQGALVDLCLCVHLLILSLLLDTLLLALSFNLI